jgi:pilus assembly protein Flp/PilA
MRTLLFRFAQDESGASAIEYRLIAIPIAVVIITAVTVVGFNLSTVFNYVGNSLTAAITASTAAIPATTAAIPASTAAITASTAAIPASRAVIPASVSP